MYRIVKASAGDVSLAKFIVIPTEYIGEFSGIPYDNTLQGYLDLWRYTYNKLTKQTDDRLQNHADHIDALPSELRRIYRQCGYWGKTDLFKDRVRFYVNNDEAVTDEQYQYLERLCR